MIPPLRWSEDELNEQRIRAREIFRQERTQEPLEQYLEVFEQYQGAVEDLLETTVDLTTLDDAALAVLTNPALLEAFRYLAGPPISTDDLKVLAEAVLSPSRLRTDTEMTRRVLETVRAGLDRRRFPWITENREPTEAERSAAVLASAALMASSRVGTARRSEGKGRQELMVNDALIEARLALAPTRKIETFNDAPRPGEFCRESYLGSRKADFVVGLYDRRILPLECKVSNSATNSVKRLNNDAAVKAGVWVREFGKKNVVPTAVLSGVYKTPNLVSAQESELMLVWAHDLQKLVDWINSTRTV